MGKIETNKENSMIETKHLEEFINDASDIYISEVCNNDYHVKIIEYCNEIVARLRAYDKLIESIEKLLARVSNGVDK